jgi:putative ABC transport system permease protein
MLTNYLKIAFRHLAKRKFYALLMVLGLSVGLAFASLTLAHLWEEGQVNRYLRRPEAQFILQSEWKQPNMGLEITTVAPLAQALRQEYPHLVANRYRFDAVTAVVAKGDQAFRENLQLGDSTLLTMFGLPLLHGDPATALRAPNALVLTQAKALKYFGRPDVLGQTLSISSFSGDKQDFVITGVLAPQPPNSVTEIWHNGEVNELILSPGAMQFFRRTPLDNWGNVYVVSLVELAEGVQPEDLQVPVRQLIDKYAGQPIRDNLTVKLVNLTDYYWQGRQGVVTKLAYALAGAAWFILLMAVVNFINISLGYSGSRLKEIGVRKLLGGQRPQLVSQFLTEAVLLALLAFGLSLLGYEAARPLFGEVLGKPVPPLAALPGWFGLIPLAMSLLVGLLAGSYPAWVLSAHPSLPALKGKWRSAQGHVWFKRGLMGAQFGVAIFVFLGAVVVAEQVRFFLTKDLGYDQETVLTFALPRDWTPKGVAQMEGVRNELARLPQVRQASLAYEIPNGNNGFSANLYLGSQDGTSAVSINFLTTDHHFLATYQIPLRAGQFFGSQFDSTHLVVNEKACRALGFASPEEAVGRAVKIQNNPRTYRVGGVVADFHFASMHQAIGPMAFFDVRSTNMYRFMAVKLAAQDLSGSVAAIGQKMRTLLPGAPFEFHFLDQTVQQLYANERRLGRAAQMATGLALVIMGLGVWGVVSLATARRVKEIGIRKVLGASMASLLLLFLREFLVVLAVAAAVASPLAYLLLQQWLADYPYRIGLSAQLFGYVYVALALLVCALVGAQAGWAARANPVDSLRSE